MPANSSAAAAASPLVSVVFPAAAKIATPKPTVPAVKESYQCMDDELLKYWEVSGTRHF